MLWITAMIAPILLIAPVSAQETKQAATEKTVEAKTPSLTFYYFDG